MKAKTTIFCCILLLTLSFCGQNPKKDKVITLETRMNEADEAKKYAKITQGNPCGDWGAKYLNLNNTHSDKKIGVTVEVRWVYENRPQTETKVYELFPGQQVGLGCPIPGPTTQKFEYVVKTAWFV